MKDKEEGKIGRRRCLFGLHRYCVVAERLERSDVEIEGWGSADWIRIYCSMCIKSIYAKSKMKEHKKYIVVNTL